MSIPSRHPLRNAKWIWPEAMMYLNNHYALFRRDFSLRRIPSPAPFYITADKAYKLYVNGSFVCRGPARGYQASWPFDEVDLASYLRRGANWITIEAYNPGTSTFQYLHQGWAGMICAGRWGGVDLASGKDWIFRRSTARNPQTARYSWQLDFQEDMDLAANDDAWIRAVRTPPPPKPWLPVDGESTIHLDAVLFGRPPWSDMEPRGIPLLRESIRVPAAVTAHAEGVSRPDYRTRENLSWGWIAEARMIASWDNAHSVPVRHDKDSITLTLAPTDAGRFRAVTLDMGELVLANLMVEVRGARGGEIIDFQHDQCLRNGVPSFAKAGDNCLVALANRLRLKAGAQAHEFFHLLGFRHVTLIARDLTKPLTVRIRARQAGYPFTMRGSFDCSDKTLNEIHTISRRTQQLCASDAYVDTPWREQAQWWGDARVQGRNTFYLDGDDRLLARGIRQIAFQRPPQGLTYGHAPTVAHFCILPDFSLTWILTLRDHWWQTGSTELLQEYWPRVQEVLSYFDSEEARGRHGLLRHDRRFWLFEDWSTLYKGEIPTFLNLWYIYTLHELAGLLTAAKKPREARTWERRADVHQRLVLKHLFDRRRRLFRDGLDEKGKPAGKHSVHDQVLALMIGFVPDAHETMLKERILPCLRGAKIDGAVPSAFWATYLLEQAALHGYGGAAIDFIRKRWSPMLTTGTTWELFDWEETGPGSCSHAWTAHPVYHFVNILAGITQEASGWRRIRFAPLFMDNLDHARAVIPSPQGLIKASWQRKGESITGRLEVPSGVQAAIELPGQRRVIRGRRSWPFTCPGVSVHGRSKSHGSGEP